MVLKKTKRKHYFGTKKAAQANLAIAQYNLGMLYFEGAVVEKDEEKARVMAKSS